MHRCDSPFPESHPRIRIFLLKEYDDFDVSELYSFDGPCGFTNGARRLRGQQLRTDPSRFICTPDSN
jgi:hypothetical protein